MLAILSFSSSRNLVAVWMAFCTTLSLAQNSTPLKAASDLKSRVDATYGKLPLSFEENRGQADARVQFLSRSGGYALFLTRDGAVLALGNAGDCNLSRGQSEMRREAASGPRHAKSEGPCQAGTTSAHDVIRMTLDGATAQGRAVKATGEEQLPGKVNYFIGNDPTRWRTSLPTFARVRYSGVYPGVDLVYYGNERQLEYDFVVAPGADASRIRLHFTARHPRIDASGSLVIEGAQGKVVFHKPLVYQDEAGQRRAISCSFRLTANSSVRFALGSYDHSRPLIIDPVLVYSTYLGGSGTNGNGDQGNGIVVDSAGNAYVVGTTYSTNFPVTDEAFQSTNNSALAGHGSSVFVSKVNPSGTALVYSTYLGGSGSNSGGDFGYGIALDSANNAYITGATYSTDFPATCGAFQTSNPSTTSGVTTGFVAKLDSTGSGLGYSTYLGGSGNGLTPARGDVAQAIAVDTSGDAYVTGYTFSPNFPTTDAAFQTKLLGNATTSNAFITKLNPGGTALAYSTYLGGSGTNGQGDYGNAVALDSSGDAYIAGSAASTNFPVTTGSFQTTMNGSQNAFVTELNPVGSDEVYSTYLGGNGGDSATAIALDRKGFVYVAGNTSSSNFPLTSDALEGAQIGTDFGVQGAGAAGAFVTKLNVDGTALEYSTYLEGGNTTVTGLAVDTTGAAFIAGAAPTTAEGIFWGFEATPDALPTPTGANAAFLVKLDPSATVFNYATLLGGSSNDGATALALDAAGNVYLTGSASSTNFPVTTGAFQMANSAAPANNAFVAKFALASETNQTTYPTLTANVGTNLTVSGEDNVLSCFGSQIEEDSWSVTVYLTLSTSGPGPTPTGSVSANNSWSIFTYVYQTGPQSFLLSLGSNFDGPIGPTTMNWQAVYSGDPYYSESSVSGSVYTPGCPTTDSDIRPGPHGNTPHSGLHLPTLQGQGKEPAQIDTRTTIANWPVPGPKFIPSPAPSQGTAQRSPAASVEDSPATAACIAPNTPSLTVTVNPVSRLYGAANPNFTYTAAGLLNGDTVTVAFQTTAVPTSPAGAYPVTATVSGAATSKYNVSVIDGTLTVLPAPLTVTLSPASRLYGAANPNGFLTDIVNFASNFSTSSLVLNGSAKLTSNSIGLTDGGNNEASSFYFKTPVSITNFETTFTFQFTFPNPNGESDGMTFILQNQGPAALGGPGGNLGYGESSAFCGDPGGPAGITPSAAIKFDLFSNCGEGIDSTGLFTDGTYPGVPAVDMSSSGINLHSGDIFQVQISYDGQNLTETIIDTVTHASFTHTYASVNLPQILGGNTAYAGFTAGTGSVYTSIEDVFSWSYSVPPSTPTKDTYTVTGLLNGDTVIVNPFTPATQTSPVGVYPLSAIVSGVDVTNYSVSVIDSTLTVLPVPLTVTLHPVARPYGAANPRVGSTFSGLVNGDTVTVTPHTTATPSSPIGTYPVNATVGGPAATNYTIKVIATTLTVSKASLYIEAKNVAVTYGQTPPQPTAYTLTGFVNGDSVTVVSGAPILSTAVTATTPVGFYKIGVQVGTLTATNYYFDTTSNGEGSVGVYRAPLEVAVNTITMTQGSPVPTLTYTLTGFVNGDTQATAVTGAPVLSTTATSASMPGDYPITFSIGTLVAKNYSFNGGRNGVLRVLP
jgi:hypothetical protein